MLRRFPPHDLRTVDDLRGVWDFAFLGDVDPETVQPAAIRFDDRMALPGSFDATPRYAGRRGLAAYRTSLRLRDATRHRLILDGAHHWCRIFVNGKPLRDHSGGFTRFHADLTGFPAGEAELVVLVDNRIDSARSPLHLGYYDWYNHGGLTRGAELHRLGRLWIERLTVVTEDFSKRRLAVTIEYAASGPAGEAPLEISLDGKTVLTEKVRLDGSSGRLQRVVEVPGAALWSPEEPNLHRLHVRLGEDDLRERIGIRQVRAEDGRILVNGRPVRLLGFNRHELHPLFGHGQPEQCLVQDVQLLKDMGCNFVRGSHYPQDRNFLDLCDETGLCVWSESIGWGNSAEHLNDRRFLDAQKRNMDEMVAAAENHPSVILWGLLNEAHSSDPNCRSAYEELIRHLRSLDATRPVTFASNHPFDDRCYDLADVISINVYPGWYHGSLAEVPAFLDKVCAQQDAAGWSRKPILISELGAEAIYGWRDWNEDRWTEQYQAKLHEIVIRHLFIERDRVSGLSLWLFNDFRSSEAVQRILGRGRGFNNKGVVDEYRRPKLSYEVVKRLFHELQGRP